MMILTQMIRAHFLKNLKEREGRILSIALLVIPIQENFTQYYLEVCQETDSAQSVRPVLNEVK